MQIQKIEFPNSMEADMGSCTWHGSENGIQMTETGGVKVRDPALSALILILMQFRLKNGNTIQN